MVEPRDQMAGVLRAAAPELAGRLLGHGGVEDEAEIERLLRSRWDEARRAWPDLAVRVDAWIAAVAAAIALADDPLAELAALHVADLYLAQACAAGDARAVAAFEGACGDAVRASLRTMGLSDDVIADVAQDVRTKLFVGGSPRIATYGGRASLRTWVRTVATRAAVSRLRQRAPTAVTDDEAVLAALPTDEPLPDVEHVRAEYGPELKASFEIAMASLAPRERHVLRHHYVDRLAIDEIGALYGVHKTTAFRWLEGARDTLAKRTHAELRRRVPSTPSELASIVRVLQSEIELSLHRVLADD
jgi:RNA polymerase sigma-70 factor, ECF subfamily